MLKSSRASRSLTLKTLKRNPKWIGKLITQTDMKRLLTLLVLVLCSCAETFVGEGVARPNNENLPDLTATFAEEETTRTYIEEGKYLRWNEDDRLTIFYGNTLNRQYKFNGATGDNSGTFSLVPSGELGTGNTLDAIYAIYPYDENASITDSGVISLTLPATQSYAENSFGRGANTMLAATENLEDTFLSFKNACGYLKLKLYNAEGSTIKSIEVKGKNGERLAGAATATIAFGEAPVLAMADDATTSVTLDCGEGVALGTTAETATEFWVVLPATTFAEGLTISATDTNGNIFRKSTTKEVVITRNAIQPMAVLEAKFVATKPANNEIWYTNGSTTEATKPYPTYYFGANILSNTYDESRECWIIKFDSTVKQIGDYSFYNRSNITSITIPDSVTTIGREAFYKCSSLKSITTADNITTIGYSAFQGCTSLTSVTIPAKVTLIDALAFSGCYRLKSVTIGDSVTTIGDSAFYGCSSLTSVTIPDSVTKIGTQAFYRCTSLTNVTLGNGVTTIGTSAFGGCDSLPVIDGVRYAGSYLISAVNKTITSCTIQDDTRFIGEDAFKDCSSLTTIVVPYSVTSIGDGAFEGCTGELVMNGKIIETDYTIYNSNLGLSGSKFTKLTIGGNVTKIGNYTFYKYSSLKSVTIGDGVTTIGGWAFWNCSSLTSVTIGDGVTTLGDNAFYDCTNLTSVAIGDSLTTIGTQAFCNCSSLTNITIPNSTTTIRSDAFNSCTSLRSITIPANVNTIEAAAFYGCKNLVDVYCKATTPPVAKYDYEKWAAFNNTAALIYVPQKSVTAYKKALGWKEYEWYIEGYNF